MATWLAKLDELWVAEKPSNQAVVEKALRALGAHWINSSTSRADGYVLLNWKGKLIAVTSVFGHMLELVPPRGYESYQRYVEQSKELGRWDFFSRSEEHTSELQSLMRLSYAVFCLKKKK